ncbi:hypothetical protein WJX79_006766 [Trebouxia sp. C0005]
MQEEYTVIDPTPAGEQDDKLSKASAQWGNCALGVSDVWDERNGLLWAEPFEKAYHALEIVVMFQPGDGTFKFQVLIESLMNKKLSAYAKSEPARLCPELQQHTFGEYDNTDLLMPSGNESLHM